MKPQADIHPAQAAILKQLLFKRTARFSELNTTDLTNDHFTFHLNRLIELELVKKTDDGSYTLTTKGKEFANRFDTEAMVIERQAKLSTKIIAVKEEDGQTYYLMEERLKQPYYGYWGFVGGKTRWGETVLEAAARELKEETNLEADLTLYGLKHKMDYDADGALLEDKFFLLIRADNCRGDMLEQSDGGRNVWMTLDEIKQLDNLFDGVLENLDYVHRHDFSFLEHKYNVKGY